MLVSAFLFLFASGLYGCILERGEGDKRREQPDPTRLVARCARLSAVSKRFVFFFLAVDLVTEWDVRVEELVRSEIGKAYPTFHL